MPKSCILTSSTPHASPDLQIEVATSPPRFLVSFPSVAVIRKHTLIPRIPSTLSSRSRSLLHVLYLHLTDDSSRPASLRLSVSVKPFVYTIRTLVLVAAPLSPIHTRFLHLCVLVNSYFPSLFPFHFRVRFVALWTH